MLIPRYTLFYILIYLSFLEIKFAEISLISLQHVTFADVPTITVSMVYFPTFDNKTSGNTARVSRVRKTQRQAVEGCLLSVGAAIPSPSCVRYKNSKIALFTVPEVKITHNINKSFNCDRCQRNCR